MPITPETARQLQAKGLAKRRENAVKLQAEAAKVPALQEIATAVASNHIRLLGLQDDLQPFQAERLHRVRLQLDLLDQRIQEQLAKPIPDGQTLNWLATAQARLSEQERQLSNRSLPPTIRAPSKGPAKKLPNAAPPRSAPATPATEPANDQPSDPGDEPTAASVV